MKPRNRILWGMILMGIMQINSIKASDYVYKRTFAGVSAGVKCGIGVDLGNGGFVDAPPEAYFETWIFRRIGIETDYGYLKRKFINMAIRIYNFDNYPFLLAGGLGINTYAMPSFSFVVKYLNNSGIELLGESCLNVNILESMTVAHLYVGIGLSYPQIKKERKKNVDI